MRAGIADVSSSSPSAAAAKLRTTVLGWSRSSAVSRVTASGIASSSSSIAARSIASRAAFALTFAIRRLTSAEPGRSSCSIVTFGRVSFASLRDTPIGLNSNSAETPTHATRPTR